MLLCFQFKFLFEFLITCVHAKVLKFKIGLAIKRASCYTGQCKHNLTIENALNKTFKYCLFTLQLRSVTPWIQALFMFCNPVRFYDSGWESFIERHTELSHLSMDKILMGREKRERCCLKNEFSSDGQNEIHSSQFICIQDRITQLFVIFYQFADIFQKSQFSRKKNR